MRKSCLILTLALCIGLLVGCEAQMLPEPTEQVAYGGGTEPVAPPVDAYKTVRIMDGADTGLLILAGGEGAADVYTLSSEGLTILGAEKLEDGMLVQVGFSGAIQETYPAQLVDAVSITMFEGETNDLAGLYLQVLEDLWAVDTGLNADITELGVDISALEGLSDGEKAGLAYAFGMKHGMMPILGTYEELKAQGYFTGTDPEQDDFFPAWEDGCLFKISGNAEAFAAEKWRTARGAYFFVDCTAKEKDGAWTYEIGSQAIS